MAHILPRTLCCLVALSVLGGCGGTPRMEGNASLKVVRQQALPAPTAADLAALERPYLIGPFDKIVVDVFGVPELSKDVQADASGRISIPLVGTIDAAGQTPAELAGLIEQRLRDRFVRNPQVTVNLKETVSQVFTVDGQVKEPGLYPVIGHMSLMRAIATAKGTSEFARLEDVVVFRTVQNQRFAALYNLKAIRRGVYEDPEIFANDVVVVGNSQALRAFKDVLQILPTLTTPLVIALQKN